MISQPPYWACRASGASGITSLAAGLGRITWTPPGRVRTCSSASSAWRSRARADARAAGSMIARLGATSGNQLPKVTTSAWNRPASCSVTARLAVDVLEQQHLGEEVLPSGVLLELAHRLVADLQQLLAGERVLVLLDPLQQELLVLLLERARWPARGPGARLPREAQHGSTCTVTSCSRRSRLSRSSTWSAMACADCTSAWRST